VESKGMEEFTPEQHYKLSVLMLHITEAAVDNEELWNKLINLIEKWEEKNNVYFEKFESV